MRLESLSLKLMDLTVLNHKHFVLQEMQADTLLYEIVKDEQFYAKEKNVLLNCEAEQAYIKVEYDLFKSLMLNLIDNSVKAGASEILVKGFVNAELYYVIQVEDNGCGIPENEIKRINDNGIKKRPGCLCA